MPAPWELHPMLVHFPIAFLLSAAALDVVSTFGRDRWALIASGLAVAGVATGLIAAGAGVLAVFTVPGHTQRGHELGLYHGALRSSAIVLFAVRAIVGWRAAGRSAPTWARALGWMGASLSAGASLGGTMIFRHGVGVAAESVEAGEASSAHQHR